MKLFRFLTFDRSQLNKDDRTIPVCFSSETPVDRGEYDEVLDHTTEGLDLTRLNDSHPLLLNHDPEKQIGVIERAELATGEKKGRAVLRFGRSSLANEIFQDVQDGIRKHISVGYERIKAMASQKDQAGRSLIRFAWRPFEISVVPVPADMNAGVGRGKAETRTMANDQCAYLCRVALTACNDALGDIEDCSTASDAAHTSAAKLCRDNIAALAITCEDVNYWSEATAADCVAVCAECAGVCDQTVAALRAIGSCEHCGSEANDAIHELQEAAECCRENAGIKPENSEVADEAETEAETGVETREKPSADKPADNPAPVIDPTRCRPDQAPVNRSWDFSPETRCRVDA